MELEEQAHWFWDAPKDEHGTTLNQLVLGHPTNYRSYAADPEASHRGQWTRVFVMPRRVTAAKRRELADDLENIVGELNVEDHSDG